MIHVPTAEYVKSAGRMMSSRGFSDLTATSATEFQPTLCLVLCTARLGLKAAALAWLKPAPAL